MDNLPMDNRDCWNNLKEKWNSLRLSKIRFVLSNFLDNIQKG